MSLKASLRRLILRDVRTSTVRSVSRSPRPTHSRAQQPNKGSTSFPVKSPEFLSAMRVSGVRGGHLGATGMAVLLVPQKATAGNLTRLSVMLTAST